MVFHAYDIRGIYGKDIDTEFARRLASSYLLFLKKDRPKLMVGKDVRIHSGPLYDALCEELSGHGAEVFSLGTVPTPLFYFSIIRKGADGGIMVTASHNPPEWNGFKLCRERAFIIAKGMGMEEIESIFHSKAEPERAEGSVRRVDMNEEYISYISSIIKISRKVRICMDIGNGSCFYVAPELAKRLGIELHVINGEPDGRFPNRPPEPKDENIVELRKVTVSKRLDFGVAFDGDGDRAVFVDDKGRTIPGDMVTAILAKAYLRDRRGKVITEVNFSKAVEEYIESLGGEIVESRVGHAYIMDLMIKEGALLGGEVSGHYYFSDLHGIDDAMFAALKMAEVLSTEGVKLSELVDSIPKLPSSPVHVVEVPDELKPITIEEAVQKLRSMGFSISRVDGVKAFSSDGWILIRPSNTMPQVKYKAEGKDEDALRRLLNLAHSIIKESMGRK